MTVFWGTYAQGLKIKKKSIKKGFNVFDLSSRKPALFKYQRMPVLLLW